MEVTEKIVFIMEKNTLNEWISKERIACWIFNGLVSHIASVLGWRVTGSYFAVVRDEGSQDFILSGCEVVLQR